MEIEYGGPSEIESELKKVQEYWLFSSLLMGGDGGRGMEGDWVVGWWVSVIYIVQLKLLCFSSLHFTLFCVLFSSHWIVFPIHFLWCGNTTINTWTQQYNNSNINKEKNEVGFFVVFVLAFIVFLFICCIWYIRVITYVCMHVCLYAFVCVCFYFVSFLLYLVS